MVYPAARLLTCMNHNAFLREREEKQTAVFTLTPDKITWILFNRKINMSKSLQPLLRLGFHGVRNKLLSFPARLQNTQTKALLQDQSKHRSSVHCLLPKGLKQRKLYIHHLTEALRFLMRPDTGSS